MINIALCDDEEEFRKYALEVVGQICQKTTSLIGQIIFRQVRIC